MRDERTILADLKAERSAYHDACQGEGETLGKLSAREAKIASLQKELVACLTKGAKPCPRCGSAPHGRVKTPEYRTGPKLRRLVPAVYEVACLLCTPADEELSGQGASPKAAVGEWNTLS